MDVVNGKIVSARTERSRSDIWSALKPSRSSLLEPGPGRVPGGGGGDRHSTTGSFNAFREFREFYGSRGHGPHQAGNSSFEPGWFKRCSSSDHHHRFSCRSHIDHRSSGTTTTAAAATTATDSVGRSTTSTSTPSVIGCKRLASAPISNALFDEEMDLYESHVSRAVIGHLYRSVGKAPTNPFKRPRRIDPQVDEPWTMPLRYLLRKVMSASDVGELARIILPKKEAEGQLPHIDTKGKQLQMKDYSFSKSWFFHYKWWANNKSRMYVLENTGEFIKYHGLEPNDSFVVYEDGSGNLVARGQKKPAWISQMHSPVNKECSQSERVIVSKPTAIVEAICCFNSSIPDDDHPSGKKISSASSGDGSSEDGEQNDTQLSTRK